MDMWQVDQNSLAERVAAARSKLVLDHPFIANIALGLQFEIGKQVPTAMTNGKRVVLNPDFCKTLDNEELLFLIAHECMHPALQHIFRSNNRDTDRWLRACDYVVNQYLNDDNIGRMPEGGLYSPRLYKEGEGYVEKIYELLDDIPPGGGFGGSDFGGGGHALDDSSQAEIAPDETESSMKHEWQVKVSQAAQVARMMGHGTTSMERLVSGLLKPLVDWRDVLHRFIVKQRTTDRTWARPARRFAQYGIYMPSVTGEVMGKLLVAVDVSGSISNDTVTRFASELYSIWEDCKPKELHIVYFHSEVCKHDVFTQEDPPVIMANESGGTAFSPIFRFADEKEIEPVACVVLTDLCCNDFGPAPEYPVLWVSTDEEKAPWGEVVRIHDEQQY